MSKLFPQRLAGFSLASLYTTSSSICVWMLASTFLPSPAASQAAFCPPSPSAVPPTNNIPGSIPNFSPYQPPTNIPSLPPSSAIQTTAPSSVPQPAAPPVNLPSNVDLSATTSNQLSRYRLGVGDAISIFVQRFPDLNFQGQINQEGNVITPLLGSVSLTGLTLEEAQEKVRCELNRYIIDPKVTLNLVSLRQAQVTIAGEVQTPGFYIFPPGAQLSAALFSSGGTTSLADLRKVLVRRRLIDGSTVQQSFDLFTPLQNGDAIPDLRLQDGDAIIVSKLEIGTEKDYNRNLVARSTISQRFINIRVLSYSGGGMGRIQLQNGSTFVDALTAISPNPDTTNLDEIALIRFDPQQGKAVTQYLNAKSALLGDISHNIPLQDNDVIVVGRNLIARISYALNIFTQPFRDVLGFLLFFDSLRNNAGSLFGPTR